MEQRIDAFISYMHNIKKTSTNTELSYKRDLNKLNHYLRGKGILDVNKVSASELQGFVTYMEKENFAAATVSRTIASMKAFWQYLVNENVQKRTSPSFWSNLPETVRNRFETRQCLSCYMQPVFA